MPLHPVVRYYILPDTLNLDTLLVDLDQPKTRPKRPERAGALALLLLVSVASAAADGHQLLTASLLTCAAIQCMSRVCGCVQAWGEPGAGGAAVVVAAGKASDGGAAQVVLLWAKSWTKRTGPSARLAPRHPMEKRGTMQLLLGFAAVVTACQAGMLPVKLLLSLNG